MNRIVYIVTVAVLGLFLGATMKAKEVQFSTLPEVVKTTVIHHYNIPGPEKVVRVVEEPNIIYEITVVIDSGNQVVYVDEEGNIVQRPAGAEETQGGSVSTYVTVTTDQIEGGGERYAFVEEQGPDAIYIDHQTNKRVVLKDGAGKEPGGVRTKEGGQRDVKTQEKSQSESRTNEQNKSGVQTDERNKQPGAMPQKNDQSQTNEQNKGGARTDERNQQPSATPQKNDQGNTEPKGNDQGQRTQQQRTDQGQDQRQKQQRETNHSEQQQTQERSKGKERPLRLLNALV
jgi:hypothetical protein